MSVSERPPAGAPPDLLAEHPAFRLMPADARALVAASFVPVSYAFGDLIVREGDPADAFFLIASGIVRAIKRDEQGREVSLNLLYAGAGLGEVALLEEGTRTATVRASSDVEALRLDRDSFRALVQLNPEIRSHFEEHVRRHRLRDFFRLYSPLGRLPQDALEALIAELEPRTAAAGEVLVEEGGSPAAVYVIEDGRMRVHLDAGGRREDVAYLRRGDFFGDRPLLLDTRATTSVEAVGDCRLLALPATSLARLLDEQPALRAVLAERSERHEYKRVARVPLDFADEALPAAAEAEAAQPLEEARAAVAPDFSAETLEEEAEERAAAPRRRRRFPHVHQVDEMDCGAACVAMVCRAFGREVSMPFIRRSVGTGADGTSLAGIVRGCQEAGLTARPVKTSKGRIAELPLPAVIHWGGNHWVVLYEVTDTHARVADPARGLRRLTRAELEDEWSGFAALVGYTPALEEAPLARPALEWVAPLFRPHARRLLQAALLAIAAAALEMTIPVLIRIVVDDVLPDRDHGLLLIVLLGFVALLVAIVGTTVLQRYLLARSAVTIDSSMLDFVTGRMLILPMGYFSARRTGDIQRRLAGMRQLRTVIVQNGVRALTAAAQLLAALVLMFVFDPLLALVFLGMAPAYWALMRFSQRRLRPMFDTLEHAFGKYQSHQIDAIKGIETVKAMGAEDALRRNMLTEFDSVKEKTFRADFTTMLYEGAIQLAGFAALGLFLLVGALRVIDGDLSVGTFVAFNTLVVLANAPIVLLLSTWDELQFAHVLLNRLDDVLDQEPEQGADHSRLRPVPSMEGHVQLSDLGFAYPGADTKILDGITLDVEPGTTVAIVGRSGSGKTTLVRVLAGLLEPTEGTVRFDGLDMRELEYRELRRHIGYVLQESYVFDETIAANIAFGDERPRMDEVELAARAANAHEFIERLPLGYATRIGESGLMLSGGQRQRIAIARALYGRPPVLLFDEATSALDTESERAVQENLEQLFEGRTSFVIAHRLSTIRDADLIVVLEKGRIAEMGDHAALMARRGIYYYLSSQQLGA